jgi:hypothetical protein
MKLPKQLFLLGLAIAFVLNSCTMDKRVYSSGYHIQWNKSKQNSEKSDVATNVDQSKSKHDKTETITNEVDEKEPINNSNNHNSGKGEIQFGSE